MHGTTVKKNEKKLRISFTRNGTTVPSWVVGFSFLRFLEHTKRRTIVGRTPLDEWAARRRDLYLTTHNTQNRKKSTPPVGFELAILAGERLQTNRADTGTGIRNCTSEETKS
jgi:hypothetical protein